ncbi:hypothetical protein [Aestuariibaculum lutulentum]|uniref:DUF805 domain-containing protein n=1 Tax=Aestuariibaculum lutulentum TaxID=2920935 RepID=A0ABS9RGZ8_9FLAO|nr:hypothetical protein [Aestuariibaculum lutulentum]MCH4552215.1 hypothetical protein [Aestuariibaculum lutulentum]
MDDGAFILIQLALRVVGLLVCVNKAKSLNRSQGGWGLFGFVSPILAMIWIHFMKPITDWERS